MEIRRNRDRLAGSSVSIVGFYDGILTVHLSRVFSHDNTSTALRGTACLKKSAREARSAGKRLGGKEKEEREKGEAYKIGLKGRVAWSASTIHNRE